MSRLVLVAMQMQDVLDGTSILTVACRVPNFHISNRLTCSRVVSHQQDQETKKLLCKKCKTWQDVLQSNLHVASAGQQPEQKSRSSFKGANVCKASKKNTLLLLLCQVVALDYSFWCTV